MAARTRPAASRPAANKVAAKTAKITEKPTRTAKPAKAAKTVKPAKVAAKTAKITERPTKATAKPAKAAAKTAKITERPTKAAAKPAKPGASSGAGLLAIEAQLRGHAMAKPEATEHFPWGERAIKVKGKVFLFMRADAQQLSLSTKLPRSGQVALLLPFATPTGYGLGKAGWVSAAFSASEPPPVEMLCAWIDESYQAVAPAKLAALARTGA